MHDFETDWNALEGFFTLKNGNMIRVFCYQRFDNRYPPVLKY